MTKLPKTQTVVTYRVAVGGSASHRTATLCDRHARARTDLADISHGRRLDACDECPARDHAANNAAA